MYVKPTAPLPIGSVVDDAIQLYSATFQRVWPIALWASLIAGAASIFTTVRLLENVRTLTGLAALRAYSSPSVLLVNLLQALISIAFYGALIVAQNAATSGGPALTTGQAIGVGFARLGRAVVSIILSSLIIAVGLLLLLVPGFYFMVALSVSMVTLFVDDTGPVESLRVSRMLIKGHWWRTLVIFSVALAIILVLGMLLGVVVGAFAFAWRHDPLTTEVMSQVVGVVANVFILPMMPAVLLATYRDLKLRREGGDLAARIGALAQG